MIAAGQLFATAAVDCGAGEVFDELLRRPGLSIARIVSAGQATPAAQWYDEPVGEWVVLLAGEAGLLIEGEAQVRTLKPGDWVDLPPHCRHRVEWTAAEGQTVWLAVHYAAGSQGPSPG